MGSRSCGNVAWRSVTDKGGTDAEGACGATGAGGLIIDRDRSCDELEITGPPGGGSGGGAELVVVDGGAALGTGCDVGGGTAFGVGCNVGGAAIGGGTGGTGGVGGASGAGGAEALMFIEASRRGGSMRVMSSSMVSSPSG